MPPIPAGCAMAWEAFSDCSTDRQIGMSAGPIPWSSVKRWAAEHGIDDPEDYAELWFLVRATDSIVTEHAAKATAKPDKPRLTGNVPKR